MAKIGIVQRISGGDSDILALPQSRLRLLMRAVYAVVRDLTLGQLTLRSMALSFATVLSMVPMLAFSFSVLKGFGVHNTLEPILTDFLAPLGEGGAEISDNIVAFVENMNVGVLGFAGLLLLIFTVIGLVKKVEDAFNYIWNVKKPRGLAERFRDYLSIILIGPLLIVSAGGLSTAVLQNDVVLYLQDLPVLGGVLVFVLKQIPAIMIIAAFTFVFAFIPNTRVDWRAALAGALVSGLLWLVAGKAFASFAASSAKYTAIYSSFAVIILFLIWLNLNWLFVLMGANIAYYFQNPGHMLVRRGSMRPSAEARERAALQIMVNVARNYRDGGVRWNVSKLARELGLPRGVVEQLVADLKCRNLLLEAGGSVKSYLPGRAVEHIPVSDILASVAGAGHSFGLQQYDEPVLALLTRMDREQCDALQELTLADLLDEPADQLPVASLESGVALT